jgi:hypothetical protein
VTADGLERGPSVLRSFRRYVSTLLTHWRYRLSADVSLDTSDDGHIVPFGDLLPDRSFHVVEVSAGTGPEAEIEADHDGPALSEAPAMRDRRRRTSTTNSTMTRSIKV